MSARIFWPRLPRKSAEELADSDQILHEGEQLDVSETRDLPHDPFLLEAGRHRLIPPQFGALGEYHADTAHMGDTLIHRVRAKAAHGTAGVRQPAGQQLTVVDLSTPLGPA